MTPSLNPEMLKSLMPFLAGAGLREFVASIEKMSKTLGGGAEKGGGQQQPGGPQGAPPGAGTPTPQGAVPPQLAALVALLKARMGGAAA